MADKIIICFFLFLLLFAWLGLVGSLGASFGFSTDNNFKIAVTPLVLIALYFIYFV